MSHIALDVRHGRLKQRNRRDNNWPDTPKCSSNDLVAEFTRALRPWAKARLLAVGTPAQNTPPAGVGRITEVPKEAA